MEPSPSKRRRKIAVFTGARSDYGPLRWVIDGIRRDPRLELALMVGAMHFDPGYGETWKAIESDGYAIAERLDMNLASGTAHGIAKSTGLGMVTAADALARLKPDMLLVLGDRTELLAVCPPALIMGIPIAHISGGDITEGAIDDSIRHAVSKMASLHFPATEEAERVLLQLGEPPARVHRVGEPSLENFHRLPLPDRPGLFRELGLDPALDTALLTFHSETATSGSPKDQIETLLSALDPFPAQVVMTYPNADAGSREIVEALERKHRSDPARWKLVKNLGQIRYLGLLRQVRFMIGNSSSGIIESPTAPCWNIDVGDRQKGRLAASNTLHAACDGKAIAEAVRAVLAEGPDALRGLVNPYGDGHAAAKIVDVLAAADPGFRKAFLRLP